MVTRAPALRLGRGPSAAQWQARSRHLTVRASSSRPSVEGGDAAEQLRRVMRDVPQPVAIAVTRIPASHQTPTSSSPASYSDNAHDDPDPRPRYHGTTLSSFTSLTLHPYPLVAFSLRLPSRMADYLRPPPASPPPFIPDTSLSVPSSSASSLLARIWPSPKSQPNHAPPSPPPIPSDPPSPRHRQTVTISLLSLSAQTAAESLSKPLQDQSAVYLRTEDWDGDPPGLKGSIGRLECEVVRSVPLRDIYSEPEDGQGSSRSVDGPRPEVLEVERREPHAEDGEEEIPIVHGSELFICRVLKVRPGDPKGMTGNGPLLHYRQKYTSIDEG